MNGGGWDNWGGSRYRRNRNYSPQDPNNGPQQTINVTAQPAQDYTKTDYAKTDYNNTREDYIDATSVLGSTHRIVTSKNFKGGDITCFMGGAEIDMSQADINGTVVLDVTTIMGGGQINCTYQLGSKTRNYQRNGRRGRQTAGTGKVIDFNKVLLLKGTSFMGGIELRSF